MSTKYLAWTDVETTGLNADGDHLLEIAVIITDAATLEPVAEPFHAVLRYSEEATEEMYLAADPYVQDMHTRTGLWVRLHDKNAIPRRLVDRALADYFSEHIPGEAVRLAGNSIVLDIEFVREHLPMAAQFFHYRTVDVRGIEDDLVAQGLIVPTPKVEPAHEALADIRASIAQLKGIHRQLRAARAQTTRHTFPIR